MSNPIKPSQEDLLKNPEMKELVDVVTTLVSPQNRPTLNLNLHHKTLTPQNKSLKLIPKKRPPPKKSTLTRKEKKEMGFFDMPRNSIKYVDMLPLAELWKQYIREHLALINGRVPEPWDREYAGFSAKLNKLDLHGAFVTVIRSVNPCLVGISGIIVMDTKGTFRIIGDDNVLRSVPKKPCVFQIHFDEVELTIFGKHLLTRSAERSVKKIKLFMEPDL